MSSPHTICNEIYQVYYNNNNTIVIEDDYYQPDSLEKIVLTALTNNIEDWCPWLLQALGSEHLNEALELLSLELPLTFCVKYIPDGFYWERRALQRWPTPEHGMCDVSNHGESWRRLYLERHIQELIEQCPANDELPLWLKTELRDAAPYVRNLNIIELQSSIKFNHLPIGTILIYLPELQEFEIKLGPRNCRLEFMWGKFTLSIIDGKNLLQGLINNNNLKKLKFCCSHIREESLKSVLIMEQGDNKILVKNLTHLDLSHNELDDNCIDILAIFIKNHNFLSILKLNNNRIGQIGAEKLADSLLKSNIIHLELNLNAISDKGGTALIKKCIKLKILKLAGCALEIESIKSLCSIINGSQLQILDLSNNNLTELGGVILLNTLKSIYKSKFCLKKIDLRMTEIAETTREEINKLLKH